MLPLKEITPYLTIFGPIAGLIAGCDFVFKDEHKIKVYLFIKNIAEVCKKPFSYSFYGLTVASSACFTIFIAYSASLVPHKHGDSILIGLKSAGPVALAIVLKVIVFDYALAIKTYLTLQALPRFHQKADELKRPKWLTKLIIIHLILTDLFITGVITGFFMNWWEIFQQARIQPAIESSHKMTGALDFFNSINFVVKDTTEKSFYALNGTSFMYILALFAAASNGFLSIANIEGIQKNIFKLMAAFLLFCVLIVATSRVISDA